MERRIVLYQCPFGLVLHFYKVKCALLRMTFRYQCPFGLVLHFYRKGLIMLNITVERVSMPSRAGTPFLRLDEGYYRQDEVAVSMPSRAGTPFLQNAWVVEMIEDGRSINALSGWYSISTVPLQKPRFYAVSGACFCRYLSEYSDNDHFSCMLTIWTYLIVTSTTWIIFSITLILQFVIRYFYISPTSSDLNLQLALSTIKFKVLSCAYNHALF